MMSETPSRSAVHKGPSTARRESEISDASSRTTPPVFIGGMHRSGTSMVSRLLRDCGVNLGQDQELAPPSYDEAHGFWENLRIVDVNEAVLAELGASWDLPLPFPENWMDNERILKLRLRADLATKSLRRSELWGWKDPRNSLTLPFWRTLFPQVKLVICLRNPFEVALSLRKRNNLSCEMGLTLWAIYNQRLLEATLPHERIVTHYEAYFHQAQSELRRLARFIGLRISDEDLREAASSVQSDSRHNIFSADHLIEFGASSHVISTYATLCEESEWRDGEPFTESSFVDVPRAPKQSRIDENRERIQADATAALTSSTESPVRSLGRYDRSAFELELTRRDLQASSVALATSETRLCETEAALSSSFGTISSLEAALQELEEQLEAGFRERRSSEAEERERIEQERIIESMSKRIRAGESRLNSLERRLIERIDALTRESDRLVERVEALQRDRARLAEERDSFYLKVGHVQRSATELRERLSTSEEESATKQESIELLGRELEAVHRSRLWRLGAFYWRLRDRIGLRKKRHIDQVRISLLR